MKTIKTWVAFFAYLISSNIVYGQNEPVAGAPYSPYPNNVLVTKVKHFDNMCWKIAAAGGTWYFENGETSGKTGFSSAFDQVGNDWIGNDADKGYNTSPKGTGRHEYRGFPNLGNGDFDHPQRSSGSKTKWVNENGQEIPFNNKLEGDHLIMRSYNSTYEVEYHFFTSHIALKIIKANDKFAFLFEGPIGGEQENNTIDKWYTKDGSANGKPCGTTSCSSPFIYFVDSNPKDTQILYLGAANLTSGVGGDAYVAANNMVVVSYGRTGSYPNDTRKLTGTNPISIIGFLNKADGHNQITTFIEDRLDNPFSKIASAGKPNISITSPTGNEILTAPAKLTLSANASDDDGTISKVDFYNGNQLLGTDDSEPYNFEWNDVEAGTYLIKTVATDNEGNTAEDTRSIKVNIPQTPYNGIKHLIPGVIKAEEYDLGGNGVAYYDSSPGSETGNTFRSGDDVDIEDCTDAGGGYNIGWATAGEWLEYSVNITADGVYDLNLRVACNGTGRTINLQIGDVTINNIAIPNTTGWQTWQTVSIKNIQLTAGEKIVKLTVGAINYININYLEFKSLVTGTEKNHSLNFEIFPNPSSEGFNIHSPHNSSYTIYDLTGNLLEKGSLNGVSQIGKTLTTGIYFLKVETPSEIKTIKITKN